MPCCATDYDYKQPSKAMLACRAAVRRQMIDAGWHPDAKKFDEVCHRRAERMAKAQR